jgi:hypothetical protein
MTDITPAYSASACAPACDSARRQRRVRHLCLVRQSEAQPPSAVELNRARSSTRDRYETGSITRSSRCRTSIKKSSMRFLGKMVGDLGAVATGAGVVLGDRLGLFAALRDGGK